MRGEVSVFVDREEDVHECLRSAVSIILSGGSRKLGNASNSYRYAGWRISVIPRTLVIPR